jgi:hypothetical protein
MSDLILSDAEREPIEVLASYLPEPGTRCPTCHRRVNKPRKDDSPVVKELRFRGPSDLIESLEEGLDALQEFSGIDPYSYPRARLLEALLALGAQQREELRSHFDAQ